MTTFFNFAVLDPRPIPTAVEANEKIFSRDCGICSHSSGQLDGETCRYCGGTGKVAADVMGIEVTVPTLAKRCNLGNIDPQHGNHAETYDNGSGYMEGAESSTNPNEAAIEFAARQPHHPSAFVVSMIPPKGSTLVTVRADLDSVGAMAVLNLLAQGLRLEPAQDRIRQVADADRFAMGGYPGPQTLPTQENPWPSGGSVDSTRDLAAIAAAVMDFKVPITARVATMETWLLTGEEPAGYRQQVEKERQDMITALETGTIRHELVANGKIAVVESTHRAATMVGYSMAPVVVALNPSFRFQGGEPHAKFTICQFEAGFVDLKKVATELAAREAGWGGSPTIIGSPQGVSSQLTLDEVTEVVAKHLLK